MIQEHKPTNIQQTVEAIQRTQFRIVVLDESHAIKNSKSQRFQLLAPILRNAQRLIMLSGTPALARPVELYTQVRT
jgi:SWI/SNF-related matrix-associated actin-dependent regulator 1 of chromatin subfamily A